MSKPTRLNAFAGVRPCRLFSFVQHIRSRIRVSGQGQT